MAAVARAAKLSDRDWPDTWIEIGQGVSIVAGLLSLLLLYWFAQMAFNRDIALVAVLLLGISGYYTEISSDVLTDSLAVMFVMLSIALALRCSQLVAEGRAIAVAMAAASGLAAAGAYLTRPEGLIAGFVLVVMLLMPRGLDPRARRIRWASLAAGVAAIIVAAAPYAIAIGSLTQKKSVSDFAFTWADSLLAQAPAVHGNILTAMGRMFDRGRNALGTPLAVLTLVCLATFIGKHLLRLRLPDQVVPKMNRRAAVASAIVILSLIVVVTALECKHPRYISTRHMLLPAFFFAPLAAAGLQVLVEWTLVLAERLGKKLANVAVTGSGPRANAAAGLVRLFKDRPQVAAYAWLLVFLGAVAYSALPAPNAGKECYRQAGELIKYRYGPGHSVLATESWAPFFAEAPAGEFYYGDWRVTQSNLRSLEALLDRIRTGEREYDFLVLGVPKIREDRRHAASHRGPSPELLKQMERDGHFKLVPADKDPYDALDDDELSKPSRSFVLKTADQEALIFRIKKVVVQPPTTRATWPQPPAATASSASVPATVP